MVAVAVLAYSIGSKTLTPKQENMCLLNEKFGYEQISGVLQKYLISNSPQELTNQQMEYPLRFNKVDSIERKIYYAMAQG